MVTTRQLSKIAQVAEQTVRNYSREYAKLLSPAARGDVGPRLFSDEDVQVFCSITALRKSGVPPAEVMARLQRGDVYIDATPNEPQATPSPQNEPQDTFAMQLVQSNVMARLNAVERRLDVRERQAHWWALGMGIWLGIVFSGLVLVVVWLLVNA